MGVGAEIKFQVVVSALTSFRFIKNIARMQSGLSFACNKKRARFYHVSRVNSLTTLALETDKIKSSILHKQKRHRQQQYLKRIESDQKQ